MLSFFESYQINHIYREGNQAVDELENIAIDHKDPQATFIKVDITMPDKLLQILVDDVKQ